VLDEADERALNVALNSPTLAGEFTSDLQGLLPATTLQKQRLVRPIAYRVLRLPSVAGACPSRWQRIEL
jgi:hypothetical protein